jgi:hypothetical protein
MSVRIEILGMRILPGNKSTRAFCDVQIGDITVRDFRVMQNGGRAYVRAPFTTYKTQTGELNFRQIIDLPEEVRGQVDTLILTAFYRDKENPHEPTNR